MGIFKENPGFGNGDLYPTKKRRYFATCRNSEGSEEVTIYADNIDDAWDKAEAWVVPLGYEVIRMRPDYTYNLTIN